MTAKDLARDVTRSLTCVQLTGALPSRRGEGRQAELKGDFLALVGVVVEREKEPMQQWNRASGREFFPPPLSLSLSPPSTC